MKCLQELVLHWYLFLKERENKKEDIKKTISLRARNMCKDTNNPSPWGTSTLGKFTNKDPEQALVQSFLKLFGSVGREGTNLKLTRWEQTSHYKNYIWDKNRSFFGFNEAEWFLNIVNLRGRIIVSLQFWKSEIHTGKVFLRVLILNKPGSLHSLVK